MNADEVSEKSEENDLENVQKYMKQQSTAQHNESIVFVIDSKAKSGSNKLTTIELAYDCYECLVCKSVFVCICVSDVVIIRCQKIIIYFVYSISWHWDLWSKQYQPPGNSFSHCQTHTLRSLSRSFSVTLWATKQLQRKCSKPTAAFDKY